MICRWDKLPDFMRTQEVWPYYKHLSRRWNSLLLKRVFDFCISSVMLAGCAPLFLIVALFIKLDSPGPVFYCQERVTQYGKKFRIYKFRTMYVNADQIGTLVTIGNDKRITKIGKKLRSCRLDEVPQLINIWKGEMTFVGTRPEVVKYVRHYTREMHATLLLPAGVTSNASILYRDESRLMDEKTAEGRCPDEVYVNDILTDKMRCSLAGLMEFSFMNDICILFRTILAVLYSDRQR